MSSKMFGATALQKHASNLFYVLKFNEKVASLERIDSCSETFDWVDTETYSYI